MAGVPPLKNSAFSFETALDSQADGDVFQTSVTLAAGDVQVSKDGGAFSNITSLPTEISSTGVLIVALTATEMNADRITVRFHDAAGDEWKDRLVNIFTETVQINDLATATALQTVDDNVDSILADTGTDGVVLANDAITAAKYDESTAFPLKSADTGSTSVARTGADGDTLESLSDQLDVAQADLDNPSQYKADVSSLATAVNLAMVDGVVDAIKAKTDLLPADPADSSDIPTADIAAIKAKTDLLPASPAATGDIPTSGDVADAVWDELLSAHVIAGSSGAYLAASGAGADPLLNTVPGSYATGTAGAALGRIGSGQITTVSPVAQDGDVETIQGDDYDNAHGRALDWTDDSAAWPELTDATIAVIIGGIVELAGSVVTATGDGKKVRVELTDVQTAAIRPGVHAFQVVATLSDADIVTLVEGNWTCKRRLAA